MSNEYECRYAFDVEPGPVQNVLINGEYYEWANITVKIGNTPITGIKPFIYDQKPTTK